MTTTAPEVALLRRRVRWIVSATITYNVVEAVVALSAGAAASSAALIGFGLDSVVEVLSAAAVAWQFSGSDHEARERTALRVIAWSFFALAAYVTVDAVRSLAGVEADPSPVGIGLALASVIVMPGLSLLERRTGQALGSATVIADSKQTMICAWLSAVLLVGLVLNATVGWSWADPLAALVIAGLAIREGREALNGDACCATGSALLLDDAEATCGSACADDCCAPT